MQRVSLVRARLHRLRKKAKNAVIPSEAREPSWSKCPQKQALRVTSLPGMTAFLTFSAASSVVPQCSQDRNGFSQLGYVFQVIPHAFIQSRRSRRAAAAAVASRRQPPPFTRGEGALQRSGKKPPMINAL